MDTETSTHPRGSRRIGLAQHLAIADAQCRVVLLVGAFYCHDSEVTENNILREDEFLPPPVSPCTGETLKYSKHREENKIEYKVVELLGKRWTKSIRLFVQRCEFDCCVVNVTNGP